MTTRTSYSWSPIEDLPADWRSLASPQVSSLVSAWLSQAEELRQGSAYDNFLVKMRREWAIETGIIERLYHISDGATKTLIEQGFDAALLLHEDVDRSPEKVIALINDQYNAIEGLYQFVSGDRELSKSYMLELHQAMTAHQPTYNAIDTLGNHVVRELPRGAWKTLPNNVGDPKGDYYFEFCPPEHTLAELDRLLQMHREHEQEGVPPDVEAAWLHHRFTLIHPFTDGNGRIARCLASLVLLKAHWFPLVVTRRDHGYIDAIRKADQGDLKPLIDLFGALQTRAVVKAFSISEELDRERTRIDSILYAVKRQLAKSRPDAESKKNQVFALGDAIHDVAHQRLTSLAQEIRETIGGLETQIGAAGNGDGESSRYDMFGRYTADALGYHANFPVFRAWVTLDIIMDFRTIILLSLHGLGRDFTGILAVNATVFTRSWNSEGKLQLGDIKSLSDEPFLLIYNEVESEIVTRFRPWLEERLILGLDYWRKSVGA